MKPIDVIEVDEVEARLRREAAFHDAAAEEDVRAPARKFYAVSERSHAFFLSAIFQGANGQHVLDYGCGTGSNTVDLARHGAYVTGIDIAPGALDVAREKAVLAGLGAMIELRVMNAEQLEFPDRTFDKVCGTGILHHLDLEKCFSEIRRVLKPGGVAIFEEPLGHNPLINWYRNRTPHMRTPDEHPLRMEDVRLASEYFSSVQLHCYSIASLVLVPIRGTAVFRVLLPIFEGIDRVMMKLLPPVRAWAWMSILIMRR